MDISIACIIIAFDLFRSNSKIINKTQEKLITDWIEYILDVNNSLYVKNIYDELTQLYNTIKECPAITFNLKKKHKIRFE